MLCTTPDLYDLNIACFGEFRFGAVVSFDVIGYPRKTWWKFWERKRTREEFLADQHERYSARKMCHKWKDQEFHFCGK